MLLQGLKVDGDASPDRCARCCSLALTPAANHSSLTGKSTQSPAHKTALKAAVPWECQRVWVYGAALNKGLQMLLLRRKSYCYQARFLVLDFLFSRSLSL